MSSLARGQRSASRSRSWRPLLARWPAAESGRSRRRLGSRRRALPVRASIWVQASSSQARAAISHQIWLRAKFLSGRVYFKPLPADPRPDGDPMQPDMVAVLAHLREGLAEGGIQG